uniref:Trimethylguanosine synthase n=1 Tax=Stomoxys calcitrans TaxID=35570 RepID=A0A1I8Q6L3_STOCA
MTQYFIESITKEPQFFYFTQILDENVDHTLWLNQFQEDFDKNQQENWQAYWQKEGEQIILDTWNEKYKDYLNENQNEDHVAKEITGQKEAIEPIATTSATSTAIDEEYSSSWNELWEQHREEIYVEQYLIYTTIFYNYFIELKNSFEQILPIQEEKEAEEQEEITYSTTEYTKINEELDQLELLGLPTAFGGRPQNSSKKHKNHHKSLHFSNFFSESDIENISSESEMEDNSSAPTERDLHGIENKIIAKTSQNKSKKKNRKLKNVPSFILEEKGLLKYWRKRFSLFSRFDEGIRLDRESWFSVTPEKVAKHLAERLKTSILVDGFCGSGGNAIQFALTCEKVIAIDIDPVKLEMAKHNAKIYNVSHKIEFILGDFLQLAFSGKLKADIVFLSPPWGGPKYKNKKDYDIEKYLLPVKASELVNMARRVSHNVALFLPRNSNIKQIIRLAGPGKSCEIEHSYLDSRLVAITALYGEDLLQKKTTIN